MELNINLINQVVDATGTVYFTLLPEQVEGFEKILNSIEDLQGDLKLAEERLSNAEYEIDKLTEEIEDIEEKFNNTEGIERADQIRIQEKVKKLECLKEEYDKIYNEMTDLIYD